MFPPKMSVFTSLLENELKYEHIRNKDGERKQVLNKSLACVFVYIHPESETLSPTSPSRRLSMTPSQSNALPAQPALIAQTQHMQVFPGIRASPQSPRMLPHTLPVSMPSPSPLSQPFSGPASWGRGQ